LLIAADSVEVSATPVAVTAPAAPTKLSAVGANTSYTDIQVTGGTTYYYVVTAVSGSGESAPSNQASAKPK
jgi:fibronectin type 3 domain-containing protein